MTSYSGPLTIYAVAMIAMRQEHVGRPKVVILPVSGVAPLTADEAAARAWTRWEADWPEVADRTIWPYRSHHVDAIKLWTGSEEPK